jgi:hypothetical protein
MSEPAQGAGARPADAGHADAGHVNAGQADAGQADAGQALARYFEAVAEANELTARVSRAVSAGDTSAAEQLSLALEEARRRRDERLNALVDAS